MDNNIQSVVFLKKDNWNTKNARGWLRSHYMKPIKRVDKSIQGQLRYRIREPRQFNRFITKKTSVGIQFIIGFK